MEAVRSQDFEKAAFLRDVQSSFRTQLEECRKSWQEQNRTAQVGEENIRQVLSQWSGVPVASPDEADRKALQNLEPELKKQVIGQDRAAETVARAIRRSRMGLKDAHRPTGCFLFLGPSGVGKTQLCRSLAKILFGGESKLLRFDMSEYQEAHAVSKLIGAPPGYVGHEDGGQLTERVRRNPWSVVLLDEFEKAHRDVWSILLQIMEEGVLTDAQGRKTDFRNTILVMTSNLGANRFRAGQKLGFQTDSGLEEEEIEREIRADAGKLFAPEFLNRLDGTLIFHPLEPNSLRIITCQLLAETEQRLNRQGIRMEVQREAVDLLADQCRDRQYGARPLRRIIAAQVEDPAADLMLSGALTKGGTLNVEAADGAVQVSCA